MPEVNLVFTTNIVFHIFMTGEHTMKMLPVQLEIIPEGDHWLARCRDLDVMTQGVTIEEAIANLKDAVALFIESCLRRGVLEKVLE